MTAEAGPTVLTPPSLDETLRDLLPPEARRILAVSPQPDALASSLAASGPGEILPVSPDELGRLTGEAERFSCIVCSGVGGVALTHQLPVLAALLEPDGRLVVAMRNALHHENLKAALRGDLPHDAWSDTAFGYATTVKRLLDGGFLPRLESVLPAPSPDSFRRAADALLRQAGVYPKHARRHLDGSHHVFTAAKRPMAVPQFGRTPMSFIACVNDDMQLDANLLASPALAPGTPHELVLIRGATSIGEAFNQTLKKVAHDIVVLVQQDIYLPWGWDTEFARGFEQAREHFGPLGVVGLFGVAYRGQERTSVGRVVDRHKLLDKDVPLPALVDGMDEILLAVPRDTSLQIDPALGFHLYGTDLGLSAADRGLTTVVVDAPVFHNSLGSMRSASFHQSRRLLLEKWPEIRPLHTSMGQLDLLTEHEPPRPRDPETVITDQQAQIARQRERIRHLTSKVERQRTVVAERKADITRQRERIRQLTATVKGQRAIIVELKASPPSRLPKPLRALLRRK
jgi:hypothetical protein